MTIRKEVLAGMLKKFGKLLGKVLDWIEKHEGLTAALINLIASLIALYSRVS